MQLRTSLLVPALCLSLATLTCLASELEITGSGQPGTTVTVTYDDDNFPNSIVYLGISLNEGNATIGPLQFEIADPITFILMGVTNGQGVVSLNFNIPPGPLPPVYNGLSFHLQAVAYDGNQFSVTDSEEFTFPTP